MSRLVSPPTFRSGQNAYDSIERTTPYEYIYHLSGIYDVIVQATSSVTRILSPHVNTICLMSTTLAPIYCQDTEYRVRVNLAGCSVFRGLVAERID